MITNSKNSKVYVGQTTRTLKKRLLQHKNAAKNKFKTGCIKFQNAMRKHGIDNFTIVELMQTESKKCANELEDYYILEYNSIDFGYNLKRGGAYGSFSKESREKMSKNNARYWLGKTGKDFPLTGIPLSAEHRQKISDANKGKNLGIPLSKETKKKLSKIQTGSGNGNSKLSIEQVRDIRFRLEKGEKKKDIAAIYEVVPETIYAIASGRKWANVL